jgi:hypothetical protein
MYDAEDTDRSDWLAQMQAGNTIILLTPEVIDDGTEPPDPIEELLRGGPRPGFREEEPPPTEGPAGTLWTITSASVVEGLNYYQFTIEPAAQSPETGEQSFLFMK